MSKILDLVENASSRKAKTENFITKFAKYYTPIVVITALLLAVIPTIVFGFETFQEWLYRALTFLVVSCPCALVYQFHWDSLVELEELLKKGVLVKGSNYLEALSQVEIVVFDKTGTLTKGIFEVQKIETKDFKKDELLKFAAYAESYSNHPISISLKKA